MEEDYIILEWRVERGAKKKEGDSGETGTNVWSKKIIVIFHVFSQGMYVTTMEELENTKTPKMFSVKALYWNLS